ncbi:hypothetical protein K438DRAFT_495267 [Mycena galopus ATCC 62051]|nr:hypothetical protein K438DRAFT_495267 [Mycena galopus ATCC 62051]
MRSDYALMDIVLPPINARGFDLADYPLAPPAYESIHLYERTHLLYTPITAHSPHSFTHESTLLRINPDPKHHAPPPRARRPRPPYHCCRNSGPDRPRAATHHRVQERYRPREPCTFTRPLLFSASSYSSCSRVFLLFWIPIFHSLSSSVCFAPPYIDGFFSTAETRLERRIGMWGVWCWCSARGGRRRRLLVIAKSQGRGHSVVVVLNVVGSAQSLANNESIP